jgi:hypothetical protein
MRKIIQSVLISTALLGFATGLQAGGKEQLPAKISSTFNSMYPGKTIRNWKLNENRYTILFDYDRKKCRAEYSSDGAWIETDLPVSGTKDLPGPIVDALRKYGYSDWYVDRITEVKTAGHSVYQLHIDDGPLWDADHYEVFKTDLILTFTKSGSLQDKEEIS